MDLSHGQAAFQTWQTSQSLKHACCSSQPHQRTGLSQSQRRQKGHRHAHHEIRAISHVGQRRAAHTLTYMHSSPCSTTTPEAGMAPSGACKHNLVSTSMAWGWHANGTPPCRQSCTGSGRAAAGQAWLVRVMAACTSQAGIARHQDMSNGLAVEHLSNRCLWLVTAHSLAHPACMQQATRAVRAAAPLSMNGATGWLVQRAYLRKLW